MSKRCRIPELHLKTAIKIFLTKNFFPKIDVTLELWKGRIAELQNHKKYMCNSRKASEKASLC